MNIQRQPNASIRAVSTGAASPVPNVDAELKMPVAKPRSRTANQSRTTRPAEGNCGASPMPSNSRAMKNCPMLVTTPHSSGRRTRAPVPR